MARHCLEPTILGDNSDVENDYDEEELKKKKKSSMVWL
jgi:hypothetical protein